MRVTWRMKIRETGGEIAVLKSPRGTQRLELNSYPRGAATVSTGRGTNSTTWPSRSPTPTRFSATTEAIFASS